MAGTIGITVGLGGGALAASSAVAAGAAAAGAIGLGLIALTRRRSRSRSKSPKPSYGRHRRQTQKKNSKKLSETKILQRVIDLVRSQDITGCGMKMVCELAGLREEELDQDQKYILSLVDKVPSEGGGGGVDDYKKASYIGRAQGNCGQSFPLCALNGTELLQTVDSFIP